MSAETPPMLNRLKESRYRLKGEICLHCEEVIFPPRDVCPTCKKEAREPYTLTGKGEIYSYAKVYEAPENFEGLVPYFVAIIKMDDGPLITAQLTDVEDEDVAIGKKVEMVTRKLRLGGGDDLKRGPISYGYKFRPKIG